MNSVTVNVRLYGELSHYGNTMNDKGSYSTSNVKLSKGSTIKDLMDYLLMCTHERGFTFINEKMSALPNVQPDLDYRLQDGDWILFFPVKMLPTQLHFDIKMTDEMTRTMRSDEDSNLYQMYE